MQFVTVRELRSRSADVWRRVAKGGEVVITLNGRPVGILSAVSPDTVEESLVALRRARAMAAVESMQRRSVAAGMHQRPAKEIDAEIVAVRRGRAQ